MAAVQKVGIVGAGAAGLAAAILLAEGGVEVDVIERRTGIPTEGSGITLQGNALRVLRQLGIWKDVLDRGFPFGTLGIRAPGPDATVLAVLEDIRTGGPDLPATVGMYRPALAELMERRALDLGVTFHRGRKVTGLEDVSGGVRASTGDGQVHEYDLVIGADGLNSTVRELIGIDDVPSPVGLGIWRAFVPRPVDVERTDLYYGGTCYIAGYCPTGRDTMYCYLVEDAQPRDHGQGPQIMRDLSAAYGGPWNEIRTHLGDGARVNYTHFTQHLVEGPWNRGQTVVIGDAAHSCPPTIAQGAAMALEDAAVLAEMLLSCESLDDRLWEQFMARRLPRARAVVEGSLTLAQWQLEHNREADAGGLISSIGHLVEVPA